MGWRQVATAVAATAAAAAEEVTLLAFEGRDWRLVSLHVVISRGMPNVDGDCRDQQTIADFKYEGRSSATDRR